jgi:hypothetical protein
VGALLLAAAVATGAALAADPVPPTWGRFVSASLVQAGAFPPASATLNGAEWPFADALAVLDRLAAPRTDDPVAPTKDLGFGNTVGANICSVGAFVAVYALAPGATSPPPTVRNVDVQALAPATNACWGEAPLFLGSYSADLAEMPAGGNLAMNSCVYGPGSGFLLTGAICHQGFQGTVAFERFTIAGGGIIAVEFSGCSDGSCWRFTAIGAYATSTPLPAPGAALVSLA